MNADEMETVMHNQGFVPSITMLNMSGDITITWDPKNDQKIKDLVRKKLAEGYSFFSMKKVVIDAIQIKRKVGPKGVDSLNNLIIEDKLFDKMVASVDDSDLVETLLSGTGRLGKRRGRADTLTALGRAKTVDDVVKGQSLAVRPVRGG